MKKGLPDVLDVVDDLKYRTMRLETHEEKVDGLDLTKLPEGSFDQECHNCGQFGETTDVHLPYLCQHYVAFCDKCLKELKQMLGVLSPELMETLRKYAPHIIETLEGLWDEGYSVTNDDVEAIKVMKEVLGK